MNRKLPHNRRDFVAWSDRVETGFKRALWILIVLFLLFQSALQFPSVRAWLSPTDALEGVPYERKSR
jgi:hypothetical protein